MARTRYAIALGANRARPRAVIDRALEALASEGARVIARSHTIETDPLGPGSRRYANAAAIVETALDPPSLLAACKHIERGFGRRPGRRWGDRPLDLDIVLWSGGAWAAEGLTVPHPAFRARAFVLEPLAEVAPGWRDPLTGLAIRHLLHRLRRPRPAVDRPRTLA